MKHQHLAGSQYSERREGSELRACSPEAKAEEPAGKALGIHHHHRSAWKAVPRIIVFVIVVVLTLSMCSCSSAKHIQVANHIQYDTLYLSNIQFDSIYIYQDKLIDRSRDTLYIKDKSIEYRYKLQHDSIPYEVRIKERIEVEKPMSTFYIICIGWFFVSISLLIWCIFLKIKH